MKPIFFILMISSIFSACLKADVEPLYNSTETVVAIPNSNWPSATSFLNDSVFDAASTTAKINLYARVLLPEPLTNNLKITFKKDLSLVDEYNNKWFGGFPFYTALPDSAFQLPSLQLTIPAGSRQALIPITIYPNKMGMWQGYILAFTITDAEGNKIGSNFKSMVYSMTAQ